MQSLGPLSHGGGSFLCTHHTKGLTGFQNNLPKNVRIPLTLNSRETNSTRSAAHTRMSQHNTRKPHAEPLATPHQAQPRLTSEAALVAEIASRLLDLGGLKGGAWVHRYLTRISAIAQRPSALALYCHAQADDDHSRGLSDEAAERGVTRQAIHAERSLDIAFIGRIEPQLALDLKAHYSRRMQAVEHRRPTQKP